MRYTIAFYYRQRRSPSKGCTRGKHAFLILLIVAGIIFCLTDQAFTQVRADVEKELDRTDKVIQRAKEAVVESRNPKAENLLKLAMDLQVRAKESCRNERFGLTAKLTLRAREKAFEAIGITKRAEENENLILKAIERTDQIIAKAKEKVSLIDNPRASSLFESATRNQQRAKELYHEHRLKVALKFTIKARESAKKAIELANRNNRQERFARRQLKMTDKLIDKTSHIVKESGNPKALDFFDKGVERQEGAWHLFQQKRFAPAAKNTQKAREFVLKALKILEESPTPKVVQHAIERNQDLIDELGSQIRTSGNQEAINLFEDGLSHQQKAKEYLTDDQSKSALTQAKVARRLITKAFEMIDKESY